MRQTRKFLQLHKIIIAIISVALSSLGCEFPERPKRITLTGARSFKPLRPSELKSFERVLEAVITVARDDLALPAFDSVRLNLYKNSLSFAVYGFGYTTLPIDVANTAAVARGNSIDVDLEKTGKDIEFGSIALLAHEYGHSVHTSIGGSERLHTHWFLEGFAEWVSAKVLDVLGWQNYEASHYRAYQELVRHRDLLTFESNDAWDHLLAKPKGRIGTYTLGFAFVDRLIREKGLSVMMDYLRSGDFERSFGTSESKFFNDFRRDLDAIGRAQPVSNVFLPPDWKPGDRWTYREMGPGVTAEVTAEVTEETLAWGMPCFIMRFGEEEHYYLKPTLSLIAVANGGQLKRRNSKPDREIFWPLKVGLEWQNTFVRRDFAEGATSRVNSMMVVTREESVAVPAGSFRAIVIQSYGVRTGRLLAEYWYAPTVKWFVKSRSFRNRDGYVEKQLVRFAIS